MELVSQLLQQSDPANAALIAVVWWRLDRRIRSLRAAVDEEASQ